MQTPWRQVIGAMLLLEVSPLNPVSPPRKSNHEKRPPEAAQSSLDEADSFQDLEEMLLGGVQPTTAPVPDIWADIFEDGAPAEVASLSDGALSNPLGTARQVPEGVQEAVKLATAQPPLEVLEATTAPVDVAALMQLLEVLQASLSTTTAPVEELRTTAPRSTVPPSTTLTNKRRKALLQVSGDKLQVDAGEDLKVMKTRYHECMKKCFNTKNRQTKNYVQWQKGKGSKLDSRERHANLMCNTKCHKENPKLRETYRQWKEQAAMKEEEHRAEIGPNSKEL